MKKDFPSPHTAALTSFTQPDDAAIAAVIDAIEAQLDPPPESNTWDLTWMDDYHISSALIGAELAFLCWVIFVIWLAVGLGVY